MCPQLALVLGLHLLLRRSDPFIAGGSRIQDDGLAREFRLDKQISPGAEFCFHFLGPGMFLTGLLAVG